jgi:hypothetical protein
VLLHDAAIDLEEFRVVLTGLDDFPGAEGVHLRPLRMASSPERDRLVWRGLVPGRYRLTVTASGTGMPLWRREEVSVTSGRENELEIDLRGTLESVRIEVVDPSGKPVRNDNAAVLAAPHVGSKHVIGRRLSRGWVNLVTDPGGVDIVVVAPGFRNRLFRGIRSDLRVQMEPEIEVILAVPNADELPEGAMLHLRLERMAPDFQAVSYDLDGRRGDLGELLGPRHHNRGLDSKGEARFWAKDMGRHRVRASVIVSGQERPLPEGAVQPSVVTIGESTAPQRYVITYDADAVRRAADR